MRRALPLAALLLVGLAGCGGSPPDVPAAVAAPAAPVVSTPAALLPCGATGGLALPAGWPTAVPLPDGLLVTRTERRSGDRLIAYGRLRGDWHRVVSFFNARLPAAGLPQRNGQIDPFDAESDFGGAQVQGRWSTGVSVQCPGEADLTVLVLPAGAPLPQVSAVPRPSPRP